jgi:hypothetical protein
MERRMKNTTESFAKENHILAAKAAVHQADGKGKKTSIAAATTKN